MDSLWQQLDRYGFNAEQFRLGLRTAVGACLALLLAWLMGLENPQWAAMTVWAVAESVRGMLIEKSLFRVIGTVIGTVFGMLLIYAAGGDKLIVMLGLVVWVGLCAGAGSVLNGQASYGALLSGYSASLVALLGTGASFGILELGEDRLLTVMTGVIIVLVLGLLFGCRRDKEREWVRVRRVTVQVLRDVANRLALDQTAPGMHRDDLLNEIASIEGALDIRGAGSVCSWHGACSLRAVLMANVALMLWVRHSSASIASSEEIATALNEIASELEAGSPMETVLGRLKGFQSLCSGAPTQIGVVRQLIDALEQREQAARLGWTDAVRLKKPIALPKDWVVARETWTRTTVLMLLVGAGWIWSGSPAGAYVLLATSVMITLFSTSENPAWIMRDVFRWYVIGACAALICRWLVWPLAESEFQMVLLMMPFILFAVLPFAHQRTMSGAIAYVMAMLLLLQPSYPLNGTLADSAAIAIAVVAGPLLAYMAFRLIYPTNALQRRATLKRMMVNELRSLARGADARDNHQLSRSSLYHRVMQLLYWSNKAGETASSVSDGSYAVLVIGDAFIGLQKLLVEGVLSDTQSREVRAVIEKLETLERDPEGGAGMLADLAIKLDEWDVPGAGQMEAAANSLQASRQFFTVDWR